MLQKAITPKSLLIRFVLLQKSAIMRLQKITDLCYKKSTIQTRLNRFAVNKKSAKGDVKVEFNYISKESSRNNDKLKILVSMHPIDRFKYFEQLVDSILAHNDCTIYYSPSPSDKSIAELKNINLMIVGVTEKYITWKNSGFVSETMAAVKKHTPILPVMLESGISNLFNTRVGKFHYVENIADKFIEENLLQINNYISALSNRETHFGDVGKPKVFISYRKRDISELNRLVNIINSYPERDEISLWYDTNLNPGDNFSLTISEQLKSCNLFLMLVTPNILEPNNYAVRVEYPLAVKEKKHILPIMMQKTDLKKLYELLPDLPKCITATQIRSIFSKIKA